MSVPKSRNSFQQQLMESGHRWLIVGPISVLVISVASQLLFTDYFVGVQPIYLYVMLALVLGLVLGEAVNRKPTRLWKACQLVIYYGLSIIGNGYAMPLPSPYMIFLIMLGLLTYFDFGLIGLNIGFSSLFVVLLLRFLQVSGHDATDISVFLITYAMITMMTYYMTAFLKMTKEEMTEVETSTTKARDNEQQVQSLINNISDGVIAVDATLRVMIYNAAALDVLDLNIDIRGKRLDEFFKPINAEQQPVNVPTLLRETAAPVVNRDLRLKYNDGSLINLFAGIAPIYLGYGRSANNGFTLILRDITREKSLEEERDEFISVISHELRTPIAISEGNIGNAELIFDKGGDQATIRQALKEAHNQVLFLAAMINDLATLSRAERGKLQVDVEAINVHDLVIELANNYSPQAKAKNLEIKTELDSQLELLQSSKLYVREVLQNFITNAIKYTETGSVTLSARPDPHGVRFAITDTGIGISKGDQERVFDKFFRSEDYRTRQANGTGLGLYVTMKLARLLHADINLESELNKGSTFTIFIPNLAQPEQKAEESS